jgi:hypothetical protein
MADVILNVLMWLRVPIVWISSAANRQRLRGARVEIVALLLTRSPEPSILMAKSVYDDCWMPMQEGVNFREPFRYALARGMREEYDINIEEADGQLREDVYLRDIQYLGTLDLPRERWGERSVAGNVEDTVFSQITMRRKAYWTAALLVPSQASVVPRPNTNEIAAAQWMSLQDAYEAIKSNRPEKASLLGRALDRSAQHLLGAEAGR